MTESATCFCGFIAIGRCVKCGTWVCETHRDVINSSLYCGDDAAPIREAERVALGAARNRWNRETPEHLNSLLDAFIKAMGGRGAGAIRVSKRRSEWSKTKWKTIGRGWVFFEEGGKLAVSFLYLTVDGSLVDTNSGFPARREKQGWESVDVIHGKDRANTLLARIGARKALQELERHIREAGITWPEGAPELTLDDDPGL